METRGRTAVMPGRNEKGRAGLASHHGPAKEGTHIMGNRLAAIAADQIAATLKLFFSPDDVFEVRTLGGGRTKGGWFLGSMADRAAEKIAEAAKVADGVYFTPNPSSRECFKRSAGLLSPATFPLTADADVPQRRYLIIDVDPVRPAEFKNDSATDAEKMALPAVAGSVASFLKSHRWPAPLVVDSGNGVHLYYRLTDALPGGPVADAAADPLASLLACLNARFGTAAAGIDTTVFNASRIMKVPGTPARKGPGTADRPHRVSWLFNLHDGWGETVAHHGAATIPELLADLDPEGTVRARRPTQPAATRGVTTPVLVGGDIILPPLYKRIERASKYLRKVPDAIDGGGGSNVTFTAARVLVHGFCLDEATAFDLLWTEYNPRCKGPWDEPKLRHKVRDAATKPFSKPRGWVFANDRRPSPRPVLGRAPTALALPDRSTNTTDPTAPAALVRFEGLNKAPDDPHRLAEAVLAGFSGERYTLAYWRGQFHAWTGTKYETIPHDDFDSRLNRDIHHQLAIEHKADAATQPQDDGDDKGENKGPPKYMTKVTVALVKNVAAAVKSMCPNPGQADAPRWFRSEGPKPAELVAARNGLVHLPTYAANGRVGLLPHTPNYFNFNALDFDVDPDARPVAWLTFLDTLWPDDAESIELLQEWFGYALCPDTSRQKMLLMIGPPRAGKGTITRVLSSLVGAANVTSPNLSSFSENFGLTSLVGKTVAILEDVRLSGRSDAAVIAERLLTISGEGNVTIDRKYLEPINARLNTRFVVVSNEIPRLPDASGALASRWSLLRLTLSFLGREDRTLADRLATELPGIFNWAVAGWKRLQERGQFTAPASVADLVEDIQDAGSEIGQFVKERCVVEAGAKVPKEDLYSEWKRWCESEGKKEPGTANHFARHLRAFVPTLRSERLRVGEGRIYYFCGIRLTTYRDDQAALSDDPELDVSAAWFKD